MKKIAAVSIFIFLTGLFAGLFFSTGISEENNEYLSALFISGITDTSAGFLRYFLASIVSNLSIAALMLAAVLSKLLFPMPMVLLWYKSFAIGFCSGLLYLNNTENAFIISLVKILPPDLFFIPAFITLAAVTFIYSREGLAKTKRSSREKKDLQTAAFMALGAIVIGCIVETFCHLINLQT